MTAAPVTDAMVFFGITRDLAYKKVLPALQAMIRRRGSVDVPLIGVASAKWTLDAVKARMRDSLAEYGGGVDASAYAKLSKQLRYVGGDYKDPNLYQQLRGALGDAHQPLHYLAIPPSLFALGRGPRRRDAVCTSRRSGSRLACGGPGARERDASTRVQAKQLGSR
jgi:glucose-6-phosphate 1-dehydrogenase